MSTHSLCVVSFAILAYPPIPQVKKDLAVHLKSIITVWLLNQHDTYREVRNAAQCSFKVHVCEHLSVKKIAGVICFLVQAAISKKQVEALLFCKQEILTQLAEYLAHTPQTLSTTTFVICFAAAFLEFAVDLIVLLFFFFFFFVL